MRLTTSAAQLDHFEVFQNLSDASKSLLSRGLSCADYQRKTTLLSKGQKVSGAYVVLRGQLRVFALAPDGNEATLYVINPGETCVLALNCIFNDLLYPAWVEAAPATQVAVIAGVHYRVLFDAEPAIRNMTVQAFSTVVFRLMAELETIHSCTLEQRLAHFLVLRAASDGSVRMTQQDIAFHLGTTREVIARLLRKFAARDLVATSRGAVAILDPAMLAQVTVSPGRGRNRDDR